MNITGILHIGGNTGQEIPIYEECNVPYVEFIEPLPDVFNELQRNCNNSKLKTKCHNVAVGNKGNGTIKMNVEHKNGGQSSSILKPKLHLEQYPDIIFDSTLEVKLTTVDNLNVPQNINFINCDIQGYDLEALKGAVNTMKHIDYIYVEVNRAELYEGCALVNEVESFLLSNGFKLIEIDWGGGTWGDSCFAKESILNTSPIVELPDHLKISSQEANLIYPPNNYVIFEEYFASWYEKNAERFNLNRKYIPMNWTAYYVKNGYGKNVPKLQLFLDGLSRKEKYFTITQYDDSIINKVSDLDLVVFSGGGRGNNGKNFPIPLTCLPNRTPKVEKDIFCSFIGRNTSKLRDKIFKTKFPDLFYIKEASDVGIDEYMQIMARSIFALCPRGYGLTSFRIAEALSVGTIPVYISNDFWKPFNNFDYGVTIHSSEIDSLAEVLTSISYFQVLDYKRQLESAYKNYFEYEALCHRIVEQIKNM